MNYPAYLIVRLSFWRLFLLALLAPSSLNVFAAESETSVTLTSLPDRVRIEVNGKPFTEYIFSGAKRPYLYPILMPDGTSLTRDFPMKEPPGEDHDHPHHRSLWFAHSSVNGIDFWNEGSAGGNTPKGSIVHDALLETTSGAVGVIRARNRWLAPDGTFVCTDETAIRIRSAEGDARMLDYEVTIHALPDAPLLLGDNKDGVMAIRLAPWMTMPHKIQKQDIPGHGHVVTSTGKRDAEAWGTRAKWCDYYAPKEGKIYGVAIFDHPKNLRHPTWWMARDYGLFAANPFGQHDFENLKDQPHAGDYTIPAGGSLTLCHRFIFHYGDEKAARLAELYRDYTNEQ